MSTQVGCHQSSCNLSNLSNDCHVVAVAHHARLPVLTGESIQENHLRFLPSTCPETSLPNQLQHFWVTCWVTWAFHQIPPGYHWHLMLQLRMKNLMFQPGILATWMTWMTWMTWKRPPLQGAAVPNVGSSHLLWRVQPWPTPAELAAPPSLLALPTSISWMFGPLGPLDPLDHVA